MSQEISATLEQQEAAPPFGYKLEEMELFASQSLPAFDRVFERCKTDTEYRETTLRSFNAFSEWFSRRGTISKPEAEYIAFTKRLNKRFKVSNSALLPASTTGSAAPKQKPVWIHRRIPATVDNHIGKLNALELRILYIIAKYMNNDLHVGCWPCMDTIAHEANTSKSKARKVVQKLESLKIITYSCDAIKKGQKGRWRSEPNKYWWYGWRPKQPVEQGGAFDGIEGVQNDEWLCE